MGEALRFGPAVGRGVLPAGDGERVGDRDACPRGVAWCGCHGVDLYTDHNPCALCGPVAGDVPGRPDAGRDDGAEPDHDAGPGRRGMRGDRVRTWHFTRRFWVIVGLVGLAVVFYGFGLGFLSTVACYYALAVLVLGPGVRGRLPAVGGGFQRTGVRRLAVPRRAPGAVSRRAARAAR